MMDAGKKVLIDGPYFLSEINALNNISVDLEILRNYHGTLSQITWYSNSSNRMAEWLRHNHYRVKIRTHERDYLFDMVSELVRLEFIMIGHPILIISGELALLPNIARLRETHLIQIVSNNQNFGKNADWHCDVNSYLDLTGGKIARNFDTDHLSRLQWLDEPDTPENPNDLIHSL